MKIGPFDRPRRSFASVLLLIAVAMIFQMVAPNTEVARLVAIGLQGAVVITSLSAAGAESRLLATATVVILVLAAIALVITIVPGDAGPAIPRAFTLALVLVTPIGIATGLVRQLREERRVTLQTVSAGLCLYLLLGLAFAFAFAISQDLGDRPFFAEGVEGDSTDFLYFSLATLTTTGYGDLTAATDVGRTLSVIEALAGQIYLVTVVALLVSNLGRSRSDGIGEQARGRILGRREPGAPPPE